MLRMKLFHPEVFQGNLKRNNYFEGWYLKHVSQDFRHVLSFIPGISLAKNDHHAFIQVLDGVSGQSWYTRYELSRFEWNRKRFSIRIGDSFFSKECSEMNISDGNLRLSGKIEYSNIVNYPSALFSPGIMGWYSFVPFMECKHGVVSVGHDLSGNLYMNDENINFAGGRGYIEKDWGSSFPAAWIWLHSNSFKNKDTSVMLSVAKIPWLGSYFMGFLCFLYLSGRFFLFSTYNSSKIIRTSREANAIDIQINGREQDIFFHILLNRSGNLRAPQRGEMKRLIKESVDSVVNVDLKDKSGKTLFKGEGLRTGLEVTENIFEILGKNTTSPRT